ncbi:MULTISPECIES: THUMP domain-containing class I SAM-dependent RNA methyltransferase [Kordiimonas]|jgi:putative N6-adenine-specific DNA methylase|uniref:THUMP domain-containing class I SAM-dependent RNA methyltransferase n=1 Tax=Kordiimonas TaxID=288021 RepID=UPI0025809833|nr:class I SAM-dependent RNA methyltransferase [Kordiimonas sp. UBA4487]
MNTNDDLEIFLVTVPGLEPALLAEATERGFDGAEATTGGVTVRGGWPDVWRANLELRGASKVLVRLGEFRVMHLAKLDKLARKFPWGETLRRDVPVRVEVTCKKSRIYHHKAAAERIEKAITEEFGGTISPDAEVCIKARIFDDMCTISVDTSGESLHKRGHKEAVNKAPMRENLAALLLRECGYKGQEPVVDPMCGSGTFVIEAAEMALGLNPGRSRTFAFEQLVGFDKAAWRRMTKLKPNPQTDVRFHGFDRDKGAVAMCDANAERAGVKHITHFDQLTISRLKAPEGPAGLVIINPPYGVRIGEVNKLRSLYQSLGNSLKAEFVGWRVGLVTNSDELARTTGLKFRKAKTRFSHGGIPVTLYQTAPLANGG